MGFFRQEYWSGLLFPPPEDLPDPGIKPASPALAGGFTTIVSPRKATTHNWCSVNIWLNHHRKKSLTLHLNFSALGSLSNSQYSKKKMFLTVNKIIGCKRYLIWETASSTECNYIWWVVCLQIFFLAEYFVSVSKAFRNSIHINMSFVLALPYLSTFWSTDSVAPGPWTQHSLAAGLNTAPNICVYFSV